MPTHGERIPRGAADSSRPVTEREEKELDQVREELLESIPAVTRWSHAHTHARTHGSLTHLEAV